MAIDRTTVEHAAHLAHVGLQPAEIAELTAQLSSVLEHMARLQSVDTSGVPPTAFAVPLDNVMRGDDVCPSWPLEAVLANAPRRFGDFFQVQAIFED